MNLSHLIIYCGICLLALASCGPEKTEVVQNYGTGEVSRRYNLIDGKKEGLMTDYYPDGGIKMERWFRNDTQVDRTVTYYKSGSMMEVQHYDSGIRFGGDSTFYEDGRIKQVVEYDKGIKHGFVRKWDEDGKLIYEARFEHDSLVEVLAKPVPPDTTQKK